jgi:hypothetical protein
MKYIEIPPDLLPAPEDLPGGLPEVAEVIGVEDTLRLAQRFRAMSVYFHNIDDLLLKIRDRGLRERYDRMLQSMSGEAAVRILAREIKRSTRQVKNIVNAVEPEERQLGLW